jgi:hypothetical protein
LPEEDVEYFGSFTDTTFKPTQKIIFRSDYENAEELAKDEIILHDFYDVAINPHFANRAKATSTSFDRTGATHTDEAKQKMRDMGIGRTHTEETKQKLRDIGIGKTQTDEAKQKNRDAHIGKTATEETKQLLRDLATGRKHTEETKQKMSETRKGNKSPMLGKTHSDEAKQKNRDAHVGRKWYVNATGETRLCKKSPSPDWKLGRKW